MKVSKKSILVTLSIMTFLGCNKEQKMNLFDEVKKGNQLHIAQETSVSDFFQIWIRRGIPWKLNVEITQVFSDSSYVYFFEKLNQENRNYLGNRKFEKGKAKLFKVNKAELEQKFGFYKDLYSEINLKEEALKRVRLESPLLDENNLLNVTFEYELEEKGVQIMFQIVNKKYRYFYNAEEKKIEYNLP